MTIFQYVIAREAGRLARAINAGDRAAKTARKLLVLAPSVERYAEHEKGVDLAQIRSAVRIAAAIGRNA